MTAQVFPFDLAAQIHRCVIITKVCFHSVALSIKYPYTTFSSTHNFGIPLRIPAMYEVKNSIICNFWTLWPVI